VHQAVQGTWFIIDKGAENFCFIIRGQCTNVIYVSLSA
jgi:hypothetical protein